MQNPKPNLKKEHLYNKLTSLVAQRVRSLLAMHRPGFDPWFGKISWRRKWQPTPVFLPGESHGWRRFMTLDHISKYENFGM